MKIRSAAPRSASVLACCALLSACASGQIKEAGKQLGASAFEQLFILAVFGPDALQRHNEDEYREWYWKTTPYRSSYTKDEFIELQDRLEFERFYDELRARETKTGSEGDFADSLRLGTVDTDIRFGFDADLNPRRHEPWQLDKLDDSTHITSK